MKVNTFYVKWVYQSVTRESLKEEGEIKGTVENEETIRTTCLIGPAVAKDEEFVPQATGHAIKGRKSQHCKNDARKKSMARALKSLFPDDKAARFEFWDAYRLLPKIPRWSNR